ncbi:MAG: helix-turn-helix domain-containing protein [Burkholderiaceae bacterium]|nr:helix-turn-helix domain-containing protein [Burkholderiaceae bacterium]
MPKYSEEKKAELRAAGERQGLIGSLSKKLVNIKAKRAKGSAKAAPSDQVKKRRETREEFLARMLATYKVKPLVAVNIKADYDVTNPTRYKEVAMWNAGTLAQQHILERYKYSMRPQGVLPSDIQHWREHFLLMNREQFASIIRVSERTLRNWETGKTPISFSMWWMLHSTLQDPEYFLSRPGFHDFYIDYQDGEALLCSHKHPEIRYSPSDLYFNRAVLSELNAVRIELSKARSQYEELQAENTRLREMYKTNAVTKELESMHEHIGQMMKRLNTADVMRFQFGKPVSPDTNTLQKNA